MIVALVGMGLWVCLVSMIVIVEACGINRSLDNIHRSVNVMADACEAMAVAASDEHDWKVEDREMRTLDDIEPCMCVLHANRKREGDKNKTTEG